MSDGGKQGDLLKLVQPFREEESRYPCKILEGLQQGDKTRMVEDGEGNVTISIFLLIAVLKNLGSSN